jgi:glycine/D-amino acid oxidase-like deaminating enzyme
MAEPDYLIVGAGIAGLYTALKLKEARPEAHIVIIEKYNYLGGRIVTHRHSHYQWENGAGRVHRDHARVRALMRQYGLTWAPTSDNSLYQSHDRAALQPSRFQELAAAILEPLQRLPKEQLARHTIQELLLKVHGETITEKFLGQFAYRAEVTVMRADAAIAELLRPDGVAGPSFGICVEGLDQIIRGLANELAAKGVTILLGHSLQSISPNNTLSVKGPEGLKEMRGKATILATHAKALKSIDGISGWPLLKQIIMCPLLRTYAVYDEPWFAAEEMGGNNKIIFGYNPVRYFIPVGDRVAMCSYTDAGNTTPWMADAEANPKRLSRRIHAALRRALGPKVPDPTYFKAYPWSAGCSYWGAVPRGTSVRTPAELSQDALIVRPGLYACGESFSADKQTWMEGALEHADELLKRLGT